MSSTTTTKTLSWTGVLAGFGATAGEAAEYGTTGLPVGSPVRFRPAAGVVMADLPIGAGHTFQLNSDTPGDLTPRVPPS